MVFQIALFLEHHKTQTVLTCLNRSRASRLQRNRSSVPTTVQNETTVSSDNAYNTKVKPSILIDVKGRLVTIDPTKFEAKRPRQDPYSHGYRGQKHRKQTLRLRISHASGPKGVAHRKRILR